ncbi:hypothetical protein CPB86DRAFT_783053 [Serendipita vermifera]|nr:hypothetical protein CPB86DRAFT_783053 [Serendipita vermifera]
MQSIAPGQTCIFDKYGTLKQATGDVATSGKFQVMNQYDVPMKFGLTCALSVVGTVENSSSPKGTFYVTPDVLHNDGIELTPIDKVVVWFQSKAEGDSMISAMIKEKLEVDFSGSHAADLLL